MSETKGTMAEAGAMPGATPSAPAPPSPPLDPLESLVKTIIAGQIRHVMTAVAAGLAMHGVIATSQEQALIEITVAVALYALGAGWSWAQKVLASKK